MCLLWNLSSPVIAALLASEHPVETSRRSTCISIDCLTHHERFELKPGDLKMDEDERLRLLQLVKVWTSS